MNKKIKETKGRIKSISNKSNGYSINIEGNWYNANKNHQSSEVFKGDTSKPPVKKGDIVEIKYSVSNSKDGSRKFKNIEEITKKEEGNSVDSNNSGNGNDRQTSITRQSSLKSAVELVEEQSIEEIEYDNVAQEVIEIAKRFEKYVKEGK
ncbi:MAG: hypothetical protein ACOCP8_02625 [archaeon]